MMFCDFGLSIWHQLPWPWGLDRALGAQRGTINVMTDCHSLKNVIKSVRTSIRKCHYYKLRQWGWSPNLGHEYAAAGDWQICVHPPCVLWLRLFKNKKPFFVDLILLRSSCDKAPGPQAFIRANFPSVKSGTEWNWMCNLMVLAHQIDSTWGFTQISSTEMLQLT